MVAYIRSDLDFILDQIKIAEAHAAGQPLYGPGGLIPTYNLAWGLRTVNGEYNNLLHPEWGSADNPFPEPLGTDYRPAAGTPLDMDGPGPAPPMPTAANYNPSNSANNIVVDGSLRTISNLLVDQTLDNPAAIMVALQRAGITPPVGTTLLQLASSIKTEYQTVKPFLEDAEEAHLDNVNAQRTLVAAQQAFDQDPSPANQEALDNATAAAAATQAASDAADEALDAARVDLDVMLADNGIAMDGDNISLPNIAPDEGLSASFNSWFTLFGQFFDHGLDLVAKGGSGTVFVPLQPDDPLYDPTSPTNFMVLTRATVLPGPDNIMNTADDIRPINTTTPFVDQNQTYTSHASHQVFLREYAIVDGKPQATGRLLDGANGGLPTWGEVKAQARDMLGIDLTDYHVGNLPLLATDEYGNFIPHPTTGFAQVVMVGPPQTLASGTPASPLSLVTVTADDGDPDILPQVAHLAVRTGHAFLDDIAHTAVPVGKIADGDIEVGLGNPANGSTEYDNELLDAHFVTGDGRGNENIGLTTVHHVFHSEHNRLLAHTKTVTLDTRDVAFVNEWLDAPLTAAQVTTLTTGDDTALATLSGQLNWDGERLFQAAKFGTEMQYQHLVFEEFARKIQPNINVFLVPDGYDVTIDPTIVAEFAHVVYRFGHSMLTETIDRYDADFNADHIGLIEGFLNPLEFASLPAEEMAGAVIRGMTRQEGNHIDEFVTSALRNNLLGLPLDLATINLARGRDTGVPSLNEARRQFYEAAGNDALLKPYESWVDFAGHLKHEASIINFVASYGTHSLITGQTTIEAKRDAALTLITGESWGGLEVQPDAVDFLNATGSYAGGSLGGLENVDLWIGGLAEATTPFGGMLGSTFNFVFEVQMEKLQNGDRFYYLQRLDGLHLFSEMEANSFAAMIMRNTDATHLPSDVFSTPGLILEVDQTRQFNDLDGDGTLESIDPVGGGLLTKLVVRDNPATPIVDTNYLRYTGGDHVLLGGTDNPDILIAGIGDDTLFGDGGNDNLEGGHGNDIINAGDGDDIVKDIGGDDNIKGGAGHDAIHAGPGLDLVLGGDGQDFVVLGTDMGSEVFGGTGNDFIFGNKNAERLLGNEGDDWLETGTFDGAPGDNFDEIFAHDGIDGNDVFLGDGGFDEFIGEGGDDIMVGSPGRGKMAGMSGFDWATYKDNVSGVTADLSIPIIFDEAPVPPGSTALDEFESMEGLSGTRFNDVLSGSNEDAASRLPIAQGGSTGYLGSALDAQGIALINGLQAVLGAGVTSFSAGDIILGGDGSDVIQGNAGDDIIDGDKWLNVRISVREFVTGTPGGMGAELYGATNLKSMTSPVTIGGVTKPLTAWVFDGVINPGQLTIVREILTDTTSGDIDVAKFQGGRGEYAFSATADGQVIVTHAVEDAIDGSDRLRNIEQVQFATGNALNIIVGTPNNDVLNGTAQDDLMLGLAGADTLNGGAGDDILVGGADGTISTPTTATYADNFNTGSFGNTTGSVNWGPDWVETNDSGGVTAGQIRIDDGNNLLRFYGGAGQNGAEITREVNLSAATTATITYDYDADNLDAGEFVLVRFAADGVNYVTLNTIDANDSGSGSHTVTGPFSSTARIRFEASGISTTDENVEVDNLVINFMTLTTTPAGDTLNGGLGNDTYSFGFGDGNDVINEGVSATSGGAADRISILAPSTGTDPETGLPILTINALNAFDSNTGTNNGDLVINYTLPTGTQQNITVAGHFTGTNAQSGVERINFNSAVYAGYLLGADDYLISRLDPGNRDSGGVNLSASLVNNFVVGENGVNDEITGGGANDLIFGGTGTNDLVGGAGDDLLVGGTGNDELDARNTGDPDNLDLVGALGADTMIGGDGNDTYGVDDLLDVVVETATGGTADTIETFMAALSLETMANVENLSYEGGDADQFVGTGNAGNNVISGGDLNDTLSGLGGNDTLDGGLGADTMTGGDGSDVYEVDEAGDVVIETSVLATDIDRVESDIDFTLGANVENLDLNGDAVRGTGNILNNVINGNGGNNQLFGAGGNDTLNGDDGDDLLDGGDGNDALNGGDDSDVIIGGAGNDTIDVGGDVNTIVYNSANFGADIINSFDAAGGTPATQDRIDLSALGVTAANFANRVFESPVGTTSTLLTIRENGPASTILGTIQVNNVTPANIDITDFTLATATTTTINGLNTAQTTNGGAASETINANGGNDTVNAAGGNDVVNGGEGADTLNGGDGNDTLSGGTGSDVGSYADDFNTSGFGNSTGSIAWDPDWVEAGDNTNAGSGQIRIDDGNNVLRFYGGAGAGFDGAQITRTVNLSGVTSATLMYSGDPAGLDTGESLTVQFAADGVNFVNLQTITGDGAAVNYNHNLTGPFAANSAIRIVTTAINGTTEFVSIDNLVVNFTRPGLNAGVDTVNGDAGDDTIVWNANVVGTATDGRDRVNGGTEGAAGDTFVINGNADAETYRIYAMTGGQNATLAATLGTTFAAGTEIVVTRTVLTTTTVVAELSEIEEIRINGADPAGNGSAGGDNFEIIGDFSGTSLRPNTITIDGDAGDDTIDISSLGSAHRIVFRSNGGNDTVIGTLRAQDVIELPAGAVAADYQTTTVNGVTTMTGPGGNTITFTAAAGETPQVGGEEEEETEGPDEEVTTPPPGAPTTPVAGVVKMGTPQDDTLAGTADADVITGEAGKDYLSGEGANDIIFAGEGNDDVFGGAGDDMLYGDAGADRVFGGDGQDFITAGAGNDTVLGGSANDLIVAEASDGDDTYFGDDMIGGSGNDTLDMSAITANITADLGTGFMGRGSASSSQSGSDSLWGIENIATGSGNDTITASASVNVMDGGAGQDVYRFNSAADANGDTIVSFQPGDKIDLSGIDAGPAAGNQAFTLVTGTSFTGAGQLTVTQETRADGDYTLVKGNTDADDAAEFQISIKGSHNLTASDINL